MTSEFWPANRIADIGICVSRLLSIARIVICPICPLFFKIVSLALKVGMMMLTLPVGWNSDSRQSSRDFASPSGIMWCVKGFKFLVVARPGKLLADHGVVLSFLLFINRPFGLNAPRTTYTTISGGIRKSNGDNSQPIARYIPQSLFTNLPLQYKTTLELSPQLPTVVLIS